MRGTVLVAVAPLLPSTSPVFSTNRLRTLCVGVGGHLG